MRNARAVAVRQSTPVFSAGFETDPTAGRAAARWTGLSSPTWPSLPFSGAWSAAAGAAGRHSLMLASGLWLGPTFPVTGLDLYRIRFAAKIPRAGAGMWGVRFYDAAGVQLAADNYAAIAAAPDAWGGNEGYFMAGANAVRAAVGFTVDSAQLFIDAVAVTRATRTQALQWADTLGATLPPLRYVPEPDRLKYLPRSMGKLRAGKELRLLVLGNSIENDMSNSLFHLQLERLYPGTHVRLLHAIRGSTGAGFLQDHVDEYVVPCQPDLVILSSGTQVVGAEATLNVIRRTRERLPEAEFLVLGYVGGWPETRGSTQPRQAAQQQFGHLLRVRAEERFATLNLREILEETAESAGHPADWYHRDAVHYNDRGKQLLGRVVARFFQPEG